VEDRKLIYDDYIQVELDENTLEAYKKSKPTNKYLHLFSSGLLTGV